MRERLSLKYDSDISLTCYKWFNPMVKPKAIVHLSHGMAEHILRYEGFANFLVDHGYYVIGFDHVAHGESCENLEEIGIVKEGDFITKIINGMKLVYDEFLEIEEEVPRYLFAHSMGSMATQRYIQIYPNDFKKVILSGTDIGSFKYRFAKCLTRALIILKGPISYSKLLDKLTIGAFKKEFPYEPSKVAWLSSKREEVKRYEDNPFCGATFPTNYFYSVASNLLDAKKRKNMKAIAHNISLLLISGSDDPVSNKGRSLIKLKKRYEKHAIDAKIIIYEKGRHELLNEKGQIKKKVYQDIISFYETP